MYGLQVNNSVLETVVFWPNIIFYTMEMKFIITKCLLMVVGEFGPVEIEIVLTLLTLSFGFLTPQFYLSKLSDVIPSLIDYPSLANTQVNTAICIVFLPL